MTFGFLVKLSKKGALILRHPHLFTDRVRGPFVGAAFADSAPVAMFRECRK